MVRGDRFGLVALAAACVALGAPVAAPQGTPPAAPKKGGYVAAARPWEHERSDLKPDARFHFGSFPNGLRWAWADSKSPSRQLKLRLHVDVGSLAEKGEESGIAHFLEHMAFNGSKSFKPGTLVPTFQTQGIRFGSDVNAHTGFDQTVYELDLPDADAARLEKALLWFRDVVDGLKLDPKEIEAEKGVVDAEEERRRGQGDAAIHARLDALLDGSRVPRRLPIGEQPIRAKFDRKLVAAFWDRWYRPENCTFLLVGDLNGLDPVPLMEKALADAKGRGKREELPGAGLESLTFARDRYCEFHGGGVALYLAKARRLTPRADDARTRAADVELALACDVLQERMNAITPRSYVTADVAHGESFHVGDDLFGMRVMDGVSLCLTTNVEQWDSALAFGEREVRRLLERGCSDEEWKAAVARFDEATAPPKSAPPPRDSEELMDALLDAAEERHVPMDPQAERELTRKQVAAADKERALAAFRAEWERGKLLILATGGLDLRDAAKEMFDDAWKAAVATRLDVKPNVRDDLSVHAPKKEPKKPAADAAAAAAPVAAAKFPYALPDPATPPTPKEQRPLPALRAVRIDVGNGVRAIVKQVEGASGGFAVEARVGSGLLGVDREACDVAKVAAQVVLEAGVAKLKRAELDAALAAAGGAIGFDAGGDACALHGRSIGTGGESGLRRTFEALVALLTDRADPAEAFAKFQKELGGRVPDLDRPTYGNARVAFQRALADGDRRRLPLDRAGAAAVKLQDVAGYLSAQLAGPIDIVIVGEMPAEKMAAQLMATLGTLPPRGAAPTYPDARRDAPPAKCGLYEPRGAIDIDSTVMHLQFVYPAGDAIVSASERRLDLAGDVVDERLRTDIREKLGTTYSNFGEAWGDPALRGRGQLVIDVEVDASKFDVTKEACYVAMEKLAKEGTNKGELDRLRAARTGSLGAAARDPDFWIRELRRAWREPQLLDDLADLGHWYDRVTLADVNALLKQSLTRDKASLLVVRPR